VTIFHLDVDVYASLHPQPRIANAKDELFWNTEIVSEGERALVSPSLGALWESISAFTCVCFSAHTSLTLPPLYARTSQFSSYTSIGLYSLSL